MTNTSRHSAGVTLMEVLVVVAVIALLLAILLPAVQASREQNRRLNCQARLRELALGAHAYSSQTRHLPPGTLGFADAFPYEGNYQNPASPFFWQRCQYTSALALLLPYLEGIAIYEPLHPTMLDIHRPLDSFLRPGSNQPMFQTFLDTPNFASVAEIKIPQFRCPSDQLGTRDIELALAAFQPVYNYSGYPAFAWQNILSLLPRDYGMTNYVGCTGAHSGGRHKDHATHRARGLMTSRELMTMAKCKDGASNTILFGESIGDIDDGHRIGMQSWLVGGLGRGNPDALWFQEPVQRPLLGDARIAIVYGFSSAHSGVVHFAFGDGHVVAIDRDVNWRVLVAMCGISDGWQLAE